MTTRRKSLVSLPANPSAETVRINPALFRPNPSAQWPDSVLEYAPAKLVRIAGELATMPVAASEPPTQALPHLGDPCPDFLRITITGQAPSGKNAIGITRTGKHYARPRFKKWRDDAVAQVRRQLPPGWQPITVPVEVELHYVAGDKRRRDQSGILDAFFHCAEKAGLVVDDVLIWVVKSTRTYNKKNPRVSVALLRDIPSIQRAARASLPCASRI